MKGRNRAYRYGSLPFPYSSKFIIPDSLLRKSNPQQTADNMHANTFNTVLVSLTLTSLTGTTDSYNVFGDCCQDGYFQYTNVGPLTCCVGVSGYQGPRSILFAYNPSNAYTSGWQATRDGNCCGAFVNQGDLGSNGLCLQAPGSIEYAGSSWAL